MTLKKRLNHDYKDYGMTLIGSLANQGNPSWQSFNQVNQG
jgi:hypothetical protein